MTSLFLGIALALSLIAVVFVLFPLLREAASRGHQSRRAVNASIHRDRIRELEQDLEDGTLSREQFDAALADLDRDLVQSGAIEDDTEHTLPRARRGVVVAAALASAVVVPVLALSIYSAVGDGERALVAQQQQQQQQQAAGQQQRGEAGGGAGGHDEDEIRALVEQLEQRLEHEPDDRMGWTLYARTLAFLEDFDEAEAAYERAMELGADDDPDMLAEYADVVATNAGRVQGKPEELVERALEIDPEHVQALWLAGTAAYNRQDYAEARELWERILEVAPQQSQVANAIRANLEQMPDTEQP